MNLVLSVGDRHRIWLSLEWPGHMLCIGRYGDLCMWGAQNMTWQFRTGPPWPVSWALLTKPEET